MRELMFQTELTLINQINQKCDYKIKCMIFHYWHFKYIDYKVQSYARNRCHDLSMMVYNLDDLMF